MRNLRSKTSTLACAIIAASGVAAADAQTPAAAPAASATTSGSDTLEEVVVTAERRTQDLQKAAVSVTALNGQQLEDQGRYSVQQILQDVPGVTTYAPVSGGTTQSATVAPPENPAVNIVIRGVPSDPQPIVGSTPVSVAYYVDGVYNGIAGDFDLNRVEILRGPQGTLYGRSATSGVLSVYTRDPTLGSFSGDAMAQVGSYDLHQIEAAINVPLGDMLALRLAANQFDEQGQVTDLGTVQKAQEVRAKLLFQPNSDFSLLLGYANRADYDNSGGSTQETVPSQPNGFTSTTGLPIYPNFTDQHQVWAKMDWNLGFGTLTYIPSYHTYDTRGAISVFLGFIEQQQSIGRDLFVTHELRLASRDDSPVKWVVGGTYYNNDTGSEINPIWVGSGALVFLRLTDHDVRDLGTFGEATFPLASNWRLTTGVRYDSTRIQVQETAEQNNSNGNTAPNFGSPQDGLPLNIISGTLGGAAGRLNFSNLTYKARVEHDLTPQNLLYGMVATGFLPGDVYLQANGTQIAADRLSQEKLTSFEVGSKNRFLGDTLQVNGDVFYYTYQGYQQGVQINPVLPNTFTILSSPAHMLGFELESVIRLTADDRLNFTFSHTGAKFVNEPDTVANPFTTFVGQSTIPGVEPTTAALSYEHTFRLPGGSNLAIYDQLRYSSAYDQSTLNAIEVANGSAEAYIRVGNQVVDDLSLGWNSASAKYHATFYVHNLTDQVYKQNATLVSSGFNPPYQAGLTTSYPRTFGFILRASF